MMKQITKKDSKMWGGSIIGFDSYYYKYESGRECDLLQTGFSQRKNVMTLYIMPGFNKYKHLLSKLGKYKIGKFCV